MARIRSVQVGPFRYEVRYDAAEIDRLGGAGTWDGHTDAQTQRITIRPGQGADYEADTLLHEVLHAVCSLQRVFPDFETEETAVSKITPALLDVLRRNPRLVKALTGA